MALGHCAGQGLSAGDICQQRGTDRETGDKSGAIAVCGVALYDVARKRASRHASERQVILFHQPQPTLRQVSAGGPPFALFVQSHDMLYFFEGSGIPDAAI